MSQRILKYRTVLFYSFAFTVSWLSWFLMSRVYLGGQINMIVYVFSTIGGLGPLISLAILERLSQKSITLKQVFSQIKIRGAKKAWFVLAILALPVITVLGDIVYFVMGREEGFRLIKSGPDTLGILVIPVMVVHFTASLITSPLFEEPGWRGFALADLQRKYGREVGSLVVGILWWAWHQPMNLTFGLQPTVYSFVSMVALSFMIDSLFNLSDKNLFTAMLAHQSSGTVIMFLYQGDENPIQLSLLTGFVILLRFRERSRIASLTPA